MAGYNIEVYGITELKNELRDQPDDVKRAVTKALYTEVNNVFNESQVEVPVEFGTLRSSGHVLPPVWHGHQAEASIVYGGAASEYAIYVHEILENKHKPPTKAKYLEDPVMRASAGMAERIAARVRAHMGG